jgi:hypothetical protein
VSTPLVPFKPLVQIKTDQELEAYVQARIADAAPPVQPAPVPPSSDALQVLFEAETGLSALAEAAMEYDAAAEQWVPNAITNIRRAIDLAGLVHQAGSQECAPAVDALADECKRLADHALKCAIEVGGMSTGMEVEWVKARAPLLAAIDRLAARAPQNPDVHLAVQGGSAPAPREADSRSLLEQALPHVLLAAAMWPDSQAARTEQAFALFRRISAFLKLAAPSGVPQDSARIVGAAAEDASEASEQDEREAFEDWLGRESFTERSDSGKYVSAHVDAMWSAWQVRAGVQTQGERK